MHLGANPVAELIAWSSQGVGHVSVEALELRRRAGPPDPEIERLTAVQPDPTRGCELAPNPALLVGRTLERPRELSVVSHEHGPALDTTGGLQPCERSDEVGAREVVRRRKRLTARVVRRLLGDCRKTVRAALDNASERAWLSPELAGDHGSVVHPREDYERRSRAALRACRQAGMPLTTKSCSPGFT